MSDTEWIAEEREHERAMAKIKASQDDAEREYQRFLSEERTRRVGYIAAAVAITAMILGIAYFVWTGVRNGDARKERIEVACIEAGGTWTTLGGGSRVCVRVGEEGAS